MGDRLTRDDVANVARLARLTVTDAELDEYTEQLASILEHAQDIEALEIDDVEPTAHPYELVNVLRADEVRADARPRRGAGPGARRRGRPLQGAAHPRRGPG